MVHGENKVKLRRDNRGSTIVLVIVALSFVLILAASLLFASYTNYMMKVTDRNSKQNQYNAETVLNEIRIGVQQVASDAIADAYTDVLVDYNAAVDTENAFKIYFTASLKDFRVKLKDGTTEYFIVPGESKCNLDVVRSFISDSEGVTLSGGTVYMPTDISSPIEIRSLTVEYVKDGYRSSISTDINIKMPEFTYTLSELILSSVPDYTVIAKVELTQTSGKNLIVDGNAYAGKIHVSGSGSVMNIGIADNFVCDSELEVLNGAKFTCGENSSIWTQDIIVGPSAGTLKATIALSGDSYVADDMELQDNADVSISGRYFGFGNSISNPTESSSIIINGKKTNLSFSSMKTLTLAGNCFIDGGGTYVLMGESISVKSNQLAYLIPQNCMNGGITNPMIYSGTIQETGYDTFVSDLKNDVIRNVTLWGDKDLDYYISDVQIVFYPLNGTSDTIIYYYMQFETPGKANEYFLDYFNHYKSDIEKYLPLYAESIKLPGSVPRNTAGNIVTYSEAEIALIEASNSVSSSTSKRLKDMYNNLCATLNSGIAGATSGSTVYDYIVNEEEISKLVSEKTFFLDSSGKNIAVICKGEAYVDEFDDSIKIIIATGDVTVNKKGFHGLVISGGTVKLNESLNADRNGVTEAFNATTNIGGNNISLMEFLKLGSESLKLPSIAIGAIDWDLERIVVFENWTKN